MEPRPQTVTERMVSHALTIDNQRTHYLMRTIAELEVEISELKLQIKEKEAVIQKMAQEKMGE